MKKIITILFIVMLLITASQIRNTLALYKAELTGELTSNLGVWSVVVNETDLSSGSSEMTFEITEDYFYFEDSDYVDGKIIAPGNDFYFDILIDPTNTDVSIRYNLQIPSGAVLKLGDESLELENDIEVELLGVEDIFEKGEEIDTETEHTNMLDLENNTASGVIPLSVIEEGYKGRVRLHFTWINNEANNEIDTLLANPELGLKLGFTTGNNAVDTMIVESEERPSIAIPVTLELIQYTGEELTLPVTTP